MKLNVLGLKRGCSSKGATASRQPHFFLHWRTLFRTWFIMNRQICVWWKRYEAEWARNPRNYHSKYDSASPRRKRKIQITDKLCRHVCHVLPRLQQPHSSLRSACDKFYLSFPGPRHCNLHTCPNRIESYDTSYFTNFRPDTTRFNFSHEYNNSTFIRHIFYAFQVFFIHVSLVN